MRFCSLGSGSRGNAHLVEKGDTTLLVECGFGPIALKRRLADKHVSVEEISAALVSHEHGDHVAGLKLLEKHAIPLYASAGTARALDEMPPHWRCLSAGQAVTIGGLTVEPFPVPHDVAEPMQFIIEDGLRRLVIVTDLGHVPPALRRACADADALVIECNYDEDMLRESAYPPSVKERISGAYGHLSNDAAAQLVAQSKGGKPRQIIAAHLSEQNNAPALVQKALAAADADATIHIASQSAGTGWLQI